jgi:hypothetical protein
MITYHVGESRNGRIKFTTDVDCLSPDIIRYSTQVFPDRNAVLDQAGILVTRGFDVCIDDETGCDELRPYRVDGRITGYVFAEN